MKDFFLYFWILWSFPTMPKRKDFLFYPSWRSAGTFDLRTHACLYSTAENSEFFKLFKIIFKYWLPTISSILYPKLLSDTYIFPVLTSTSYIHDINFSLYLFVILCYILGKYLSTNYQIIYFSQLCSWSSIS